jgi:hypothetical protein
MITGMRNIKHLSTAIGHASRACRVETITSKIEHRHCWQLIRGAAMLPGADRGIVYDWTCVGGLTLAGIAAALLSTNLERNHCAAEVPLPNANPKGDQFVSQFRDWQVETKCDSAAIAIAPSKNVSLNAQFRTAMTYVENCCTFDTLPRSSIGAIKHCRRQFRPPVPHLQGRGKYATIFLKRFKYSTCKVEHKIISMPVHSVGD